MPVFPPKTLTILHTALRHLGEDMISATNLRLTGDEFIQAFVRAEHVPLLKEVQAMCDPPRAGYASTNLFSAEGDKLTCSMMFANTGPILVPRYAYGGYQPDAPAELQKKINEWVAHRINLGRAFGDATDALQRMDLVCGDAKAVSIMLPCLSAIMAKASTSAGDRMEQAAAKLQETKKIGTLPRLPPEVKQRMQEVSGFVSAATLLKGAETPPLRMHDVTISLQTVTYPTVANRPRHLFDSVFEQVTGSNSVGSFL
jgi:hypothetical protein